jgi:hypothetical protein
VASTLRLYFDGERAGPLFRRATERAGAKVRSATRATAVEAAFEIQERGRADILAAPGNWGSRWAEGLKTSVTEGGGSIRIATTHDIPYFNVFEHGAVIHGKPLLWIPLSFADDATKGMWSESGGTGIRARDYPGQLFRVDRKDGKAPLLMTPGSAGQPAQAKYFGKPEVTIPQKFHITDIIKDVARHMKDIYRKYLRENK